MNQRHRWTGLVSDAEIAKDCVRKLLQVLSRAGFYIQHQTGSHANLRHRTNPQLHIVVPRHSGDLALKTLKSIIMQADMTVEEFVALLNE